jgi:hypothetical protein
MHVAQLGSIADWWKKNGPSATLTVMFVVVFAGQAVAGFLTQNQELAEHGQPTVSLGAHLLSSHFYEATFENWESEFVQMALFVLLTTILYQEGSSESKCPDVIEPVDVDPRQVTLPNDAPRPVRRGGRWLKVYEQSLGLAFALLFLLSIAGHAISGAAEHNADARMHGGEMVTLFGYLAEPRFWFESFRTGRASSWRSSRWWCCRSSCGSAVTGVEAGLCTSLRDWQAEGAARVLRCEMRILAARGSPLRNGFLYAPRMPAVPATEIQESVYAGGDVDVRARALLAGRKRHSDDAPLGGLIFGIHEGPRGANHTSLTAEPYSPAVLVPDVGSLPVNGYTALPPWPARSPIAAHSGRCDVTARRHAPRSWRLKALVWSCATREMTSRSFGAFTAMARTCCGKPPLSDSTLNGMDGSPTRALPESTLARSESSQAMLMADDNPPHTILRCPSCDSAII